MNNEEAMIDELRKEREKAQIIAATKRAAGSGGLSGAVMGAIGSIGHGEKKLGGLARSAALAGLAGAGIGGGTQYLGQKLGGPVGEDEGGGHANRGALGGAVAGGLSGLALGGLLGAGKLGWLKRVGPIAREVEKEEGGALNNLATDHLKKLLAHGKNGRLAATLGLGGSALGGAYGFNEGVDADYAKAVGRHPDDEEQDQ